MRRRLLGEESGFMVLLIVIIAGAVAAATASSLLLISALNSQSALSSEQSYTAQSLASGCAESALQQIYNNPTYTGTASVTISGNNCSYTVTAGAGQARTITTTTTYNNLKRHVQIAITQITPIISYSSWVEN